MTFCISVQLFFVRFFNFFRWSRRELSEILRNTQNKNGKVNATKLRAISTNVVAFLKCLFGFYLWVHPYFSECASGSNSKLEQRNWRAQVKEGEVLRPKAPCMLWIMQERGSYAEVHELHFHSFPQPHDKGFPPCMHTPEIQVPLQRKMWTLLVQLIASLLFICIGEIAAATFLQQWFGSKQATFKNAKYIRFSSLTFQRFLKDSFLSRYIRNFSCSWPLLFWKSAL